MRSVTGSESRGESGGEDPADDNPTTRLSRSDQRGRRTGVSSTELAEAVAARTGSVSMQWWRSLHRANAYGAGGVVVFVVLALLTTVATGEINTVVLAGGLTWVAVCTAGWALLRGATKPLLFVWPVLLTLSALGLTVVAPSAGALLVSAQTLGFVFIGQTYRPGWFVALLPLAWATAWLAYDLPLREALIRLTIATIIWAVTAELPARLLRRVEHLASTDPLTGLANRSQMNSVLAELERRTAAGRPAPALVLLDLDHFKSYNDTHGHLGGDDLLRAFGTCITANTRRTDFTYRFGGEEFLLIFDQVTPQQAAVLVARLRTSWSQHPAGTTFSAGIGTTLSQADRNLYQAKESGRNTTMTTAAAG